MPEKNKLQGQYILSNNVGYLIMTKQSIISNIGKSLKLYAANGMALKYTIH